VGPHPDARALEALARAVHDSEALTSRAARLAATLSHVAAARALASVASTDTWAALALTASP